MKKNIAVIGGGITGLATAYYLLTSPHASSINVTVYEPAPKLGGMIDTHHTEDGFTLECGPNVIVFKQELEALVEALGIEPLFPGRYRQQVYHYGCLHDVPKSPLAFIRTKLLSTRGKIECLRALFKKPFNHTSEQQSVADFFAPFGQEVVWRLIDPAIQGVYGGDITSLRAKSVFPDLWRAVVQGDSLFGYMWKKPKSGKRGRLMGTLEGGLSTLCNRLAERIPATAIQHRRVIAVEQKKEGAFEVQSSDEHGNVQTAPYDAVCITTNASTMSSMLVGYDRLKTSARTVATVPLAVVHMEATSDSKIQKRSFGALWPSTQKTDFKGVLQSSELFPHVAPEGKILITSMIGGLTGQQATPEQLLELCRRELAPFAIVPKRLLKVTRWPMAITQYGPTHQDFCSALDDVTAKARGFYFLGTEIGGVGIADRVAVAKKTSDKVVDELFSTRTAKSSASAPLHTENSQAA